MSCDLFEPYKRQRSILVFHCEFSSERAPRQLRYLRACDRTRNPYPRLHYPEIYLLKGGYKEFYHTYKELCVPEEYLPMLDDRYNKEYKLFRTGYFLATVFFSSPATRSDRRISQKEHQNWFRVMRTRLYRNDNQ